MRKKPSRKRGEETVGTILEATAQILQHEEPERLTTNRIAAEAGFSIGALYQYFPDKNAILLALAERERQRVTAQVRAALVTREGEPLEDIVRRVVHICLRVLNGKFRVRRILMQRVIASGNVKIFSDALTATANEVAKEIARLRRPDLRSPTDASIYVMSRALLGTVRSAILEESFMLKRREFEDELVLLLCRYLRKDIERGNEE